MNRSAIIWSTSLILYAVFCFWYTNTGGPMSEAEQQTLIEHLQARGYGEKQLDGLKRFMETDTGDQFLMVNNIDMNPDPADVAGAEPGESAEQLMARYMEYMYPALIKRACHPVFMGQTINSSMDITGIKGAESWTSAALMRYRSRRDLLEIATNPAFAGRHEFKLAALTKTIAYPVDTTLYLSDPRLLLFLILLSLCALIDRFTGR